MGIMPSSIEPRTSMDKRQLLDRVARDGEERLLLARVLDRYEQCQARNVPAATGFLSAGEQAAAQALLNAAGIREGYMFAGGYEGAERRLIYFLPDWGEGLEPPIAALRAVFRGQERPGHRDCLGSLMGLGIAREKLGDILLSEESCDLLAAEDLADFLVQSWESAGRVRLLVERIGLDELKVPEARFETVRDTVMSLRLDAVASAAFGLSRSRAAELIAAGRVSLNHAPCLKGDRLVAEGDVLTARGFGKCVLREVGGLSRKGRTTIVLQRFQ